MDVCARAQRTALFGGFELISVITHYAKPGSDRDASTSERERERSSFHAMRLFFSYILILLFVYFVFSVSSTLLNTQCGAMLRNWLRKLL